MKPLLRRITQNRTTTSVYITIVAISIGVFLVGMTITSVFARTAATQNEVNFAAQLDQNIVTVHSQLVNGLDSYNTVLRAAAAQVTANPDMTRDEWAQFYLTMRIQAQYPALQGVGYVRIVTPGGGGDVAAWPEGGRAEYAPIVYLEPQNDVNLRAIGYDMYTEQSRHEAMELARDSGEPVMTSPVTLVQDGDKAVNPGVLVYQAVYAGMPSTTAERRAGLIGYAYVVFRPHDSMRQIVNNTPRLRDNLTIQLHAQPERVELYKADFSTGQKGDKKYVERDIAINHQAWKLEISGSDVSINEVYGPLGLFFLGSIVSAFIAFIVYGILVYRMMRVQRHYEEAVENTKNELLALASHQLRTPASGVKQYLGILRDGSFGSLTPAQQSLADKAYITNERQLHVINDLLYVSKVEAGQLQIDPVPCDLAQITRDVLSHMDSQAKQKDITIQFRGAKPRPVVADDRYVTMIVENLVSNAIKYSRRGSKVKVTIESKDGALRLAVKDSGVGIEMKDHERIFKKFDRVQNPLSHDEGGTGLGLFLARQLARGHGGDIVVESVIEKGSTFTLILPKIAMIDNDILDMASEDKRAKSRSPWRRSGE